ncbi:hypothetical protein RHGRI_009809 [Rhododendron griersonianum]|uniref:Trichome birefringence-like N-terminal domain-containing protein n=1 Tax=Rhododendron griersonianum TaxID=479676 RepID=A0AAV6KG54_9ERIC|nr:hypothetical protein RHGRI_009809 [Rhododendron griersonianum]
MSLAPERSLSMIVDIDDGKQREEGLWVGEIVVNKKKGQDVAASSEDLEQDQTAVSCSKEIGSMMTHTLFSLYNSSMCPFIEQQFDCQGNGRPDKLYLKYRWKPTACELPR